MDFKLVDGKFYEHNKVTVSINGKIISRIVRYNTMDGLYIVYQNRKYFEYELDYCLDKKEGGDNNNLTTADKGSL